MIHPNSTASYNEQREKGKTNHFRKAIFDLLSNSKAPMTDRDFMVALNEDDVNNVRPEVTRLKQDGLIVEVGKVTCPYTGKKVRQTMITGAPYKARPRPKKGAL